MFIEDTGYLAVLVTASSSEEARKIAHELLNRRKAACISIVPGVSSFFWWQGKLDSAEENLLVIKTKTSLLDEVVALVRQIHSYKVPEIIALPVVGGSKDYLEWLGKEVE
jgi:periplasmic divalent cation tolerance protein